ncbi:helix-turn-helix transcriptional regulator [Gloeobacter morelensis]|uniref:WYL domain-containing protein n=1 Tax=Gloeobacter morelensis MG652769 TaxID=2781736 RepID=A0ABY3PM12_9CYAN|nr:WYL domain-containing protein [Gloeobacter morelensis]UFP94654.1 WYL domain-containing protein [Gloeobacter morelensis MG652769]
MDPAHPAPVEEKALPDRGRLKQRYCRLLKIQQLLLASENGLTPRQLHEALSKLGHPFDIKERRLYDDLQFLAETLEEGTFFNDNGRYRVVLSGGQVALTAQEAQFCLRLVAGLSTRVLTRETRRQRENLFRRAGNLYPLLMEKVKSPPEQILFPVTYQLEDEADQGVMFATLTSAIEAKKQVNLQFKDSSLGQVLGCCPLRLLFYIRAWYLIGYCNPPSGLKKKMRRQLCALRLDNIEQAEVLIAGFKLSEQMNVDAALDRAWGLNFYDPICEAVLRFSPALAERIERNRRHPTATLERQSDGSLIFKVFYYEGSLDFRQWVRQYGPEVEVREPAQLREQMIQDWQTALGLYHPCEAV